MLGKSGRGRVSKKGGGGETKVCEEIQRKETRMVGGGDNGGNGKGQQE